MKNLFSLLIAILFGSKTLAAWNEQFVSVADSSLKSLEQVISNIQPGDIVLMGERHDYKPEHDNQVIFLKELARLKPQAQISVGMEFFEFPKQGLVQDYLDGKLEESLFLKSVGWGKNDFSQYRDQVLFPAQNGGQTFALNLPMRIANQIAKVGSANLSASDAAYLPPSFQVGRDSYRERFYEIMGQGHNGVPEASLQKYFEAQSSWDDTMAYQATRAMALNPNQILVVIVGQFHVEYGGGLRDRLLARGAKNVVSLLQYTASEGSEADLKEHITPDSKYGPISDFVWIIGEPTK